MGLNKAAYLKRFMRFIVERAASFSTTLRADGPIEEANLQIHGHSLLSITSERLAFVCFVVGARFVRGLTNKRAKSGSIILISLGPECPSF